MSVVSSCFVTTSNTLKYCYKVVFLFSAFDVVLVQIVLSFIKVFFLKVVWGLLNIHMVYTTIYIQEKCKIYGVLLVRICAFYRLSNLDFRTSNKRQLKL